MSARSAAVEAFLAALLVMVGCQLHGQNRGGFSTGVGVLPGGGLSGGLTRRDAERETYRVNRHEVTWVHGWPWRYLTRQTSYCPADATFDPADASPWSVRRGVVAFNARALFGNVVLSVAVAAALALLVFNVLNRDGTPR
jgi:hypothetical protein